MNANHAGFSSKHWTSTRRMSPERPLDLSGLVEQCVRWYYESDQILRGVERVFPLADLTLAEPPRLASTDPLLERRTCCACC